MLPIPLARTALFGILLPTLCLTPVAQADHGVCGREASSTSQPRPAVSLYEPSQRAVILWNGQEEILSLSTDIGHSESGIITEFSPFPSLPIVKGNSLSQFATFSQIASEYGNDLSDIEAKLQQGQISLLMTGTIIHVREFFGASNDYEIIRPNEKLITEGGIKPCARVANYFSSRGLHYFSFDEIVVNSQVQSYPPIEYRFHSGKLFYPLEVSTGNYGETTIDLVLVTHKPVTRFSATDYPIQQRSQFVMASRDLARVSPEWAAFMGDRPVHVRHVRIVGDIQKMHRDFGAFVEAEPAALPLQLAPLLQESRGPASPPGPTIQWVRARTTPPGPTRRTSSSAGRRLSLLLTHSWRMNAE